LRVFIPSLVVVVLDQLSKLWIKNNFNLFESRNIMGEFLRFSYVENPGIAFGIRLGDLKVVVTIISIVIVSYLAFILYSSKQFVYVEKLSLSLILGGAIGNLIDRFLIYIPNSTYTGVIDFIDVGITTHRWYIFNIADSAITVGITLYLIYSTFFENKEIISDVG
jgi:signal peptidase II